MTLISAGTKYLFRHDFRFCINKNNFSVLKISGKN